MNVDMVFAVILLKDPKSVSLPRMAEFFRTHWPDGPAIAEEDLNLFPIPKGP